MKKTVHTELRSLSHLIFRTIENSPNRKKIESITGTNGCIIGYLSENSSRDVFQRDIEKNFGITRSTASKVINLMEQKGLVKREKVEHDERLKKIVMTEKSEAVSLLIMEDIARTESMLTNGFSKEELENLFNYIERMKSNLKNQNMKKEED